jgi:hypothetical protein
VSCHRRRSISPSFGPPSESDNLLIKPSRIDHFDRTVCGIFGLLLHDTNVDAAPEICDALSLLQHRGQDACGIVTCGPKGRFYQCKANGMVRDVFDSKAVTKLIGAMGIGHGGSQSRQPLPAKVAVGNIYRSPISHGWQL